MKRLAIAVVALALQAGTGWAQVSGNVAYTDASGRARAERNERSKRTLTTEEMPASATGMFLEASVLMNVKADEYVVVFGLAQEGKTVTQCTDQMNATLKSFRDELKPLGIGDEETFVDFVAQNKIYGYQLEGNVARENLVGLELKKNIAVHYKDKAMLDQLILAAAHAKIYDLIKVDYIVKDPAAVQNRLMEEATRIIQQKQARYAKLLNISFQPNLQVYAEKPSIYYPTEMYDAYTAYEAEAISQGYDRSKYVVQGARKSRTFFFNALDADGFDTVINPVVLEPVVQFTLYLKVKCDTAPSKSKKPR